MTDPTPSTGEALLARLFAELERTPPADRPAVVERYAREYPDRADEIRQTAALADGVAVPFPPVTPPPADLAPGDLLGPFRVVKYVTHGGMGDVYEATQAVLNRRVALKVIRPKSVNPQTRARFEREQQALALLHQTNVVPVFSAGACGEVQYYAMPFINGATLHRVLSTVRDGGETGDRTPPMTQVVSSLLKSDAAPPADAASTAAYAPPAPPADPTRRRLSADYFASVAAVLAQVADAVQHGHDLGIVHRDLKPSNLMLDAAGTCWVIDYGVAWFDPKRIPATADAGAAPVPGDGDRITQAGAWPGTPPYMAPKQFDAPAGTPAMDVWQLGATLYELLTLRRAFDAPGADYKAMVRDTEPADPRNWVANTPADLVAICRKAMTKEPAGRYPTAAAFAADLRRWKGWEPTSVRPGWGTLRPLRLWARRKPERAMAVLAAVVLAVTAPTAWAYQREMHRQRERQFQAAVQDARDIQTGTPFLGWSEVAWKRLTDARDVLPGADLREYAVAALTGPEARVVLPYQRPEPAGGKVVGYSGLAFGPGGWLLAAGDRHGGDLCPALLFDPNPARPPEASALAGAGPVAFPDADTPVQLVLPAGDRTGLRLWHVGRNQPLADIPLPAETWAVESLTAALSADGRVAAVTARSVPDKNGERSGYVRLWAVDPTAAKPAKPLGGWDRPAGVLALSPDGRFLAAGSRDGTVGVHATADAAELFRIDAGRLPVRSLAFGRNFRRDASGRPSADGPPWLLGVGTDGGMATVWDLTTRRQVSVIRGMRHYVNALAFTPDGSGLVTVGSEAPVLWDVATARPAFSLTEARNGTHPGYRTAVAVSPDGRRVAHGSNNHANWRRPARLEVVEFDSDRGVRAYRGLASSVEKVWLSPSAKWVAALSDEWQVGVWERETGQLRHVWDVPVGLSADNADLVFEAGEGALLFASGERATRLDLGTGAAPDRWTIPRGGVNDLLVIRPDEPPNLIRREGNVIRCRELLADGRTRERYAIPLDPAETGPIHNLRRLGGGKYVFVKADLPAAPGRSHLYDAATGRPAALPANVPFPNHRVATVSPDGSVLALEYEDGHGRHTLFYQLPGMTPLGTTMRDTQVDALDDRGRLAVSYVVEDGSGLAVFRVGERRPVLTFGRVRNTSFSPGPISPDGRFCVWGNADGMVHVADITRCLERIATFPRAEADSR